MKVVKVVNFRILIITVVNSYPFEENFYFKGTIFKITHTEPIKLVGGNAKYGYLSISRGDMFQLVREPVRKVEHYRKILLRRSMIGAAKFHYPTCPCENGFNVNKNRDGIQSYVAK